MFYAKFSIVNYANKYMQHFLTINNNNNNNNNNMFIFQVISNKDERHQNNTSTNCSSLLPHYDNSHCRNIQYVHLFL